MKIKYLCLTSVFAALVFIITRFIQIPIPLGYFNIGNCMILSFSLFLPMPYAVVMGGIGSALADLTSYPEWTIPTLIIKMLMPFVFKLLMSIRFPKSKIILAVIASAVSMLIPLFGYTVSGMILYGSVAAGLSQFVGLSLEYAANLFLFIVMYIVIDRTHLVALVKRDN